MEMPHTNLTKVTRVVLVKVDPKKNHHEILSKSKKSTHPRTGGGVHHQQDHVLPDACGACLHDHIQQTHARDVFEYSRIVSAFFSTNQVLANV